MDNNGLITRLKKYPELKKHSEELLGIARESCENIVLADDAKEKTILATRYR